MAWRRLAPGSGVLPQEAPSTDMVSMSRVCEVGGPPVSKRSEADSGVGRGGVAGALSPSVPELRLHRLSPGFLSAAPPSPCWIPSRCGARQRVLWELSPLCGTVDWSCCGAGFPALFSAAVVSLRTFQIPE